MATRMAQAEIEMCAHLYERGLTIRAIAARISRSYNGVRDALLAAGVPMRTQGYRATVVAGPTGEALTDAHRLILRHLADGATIHEIATIAGISRTTVYAQLSEARIVLGATTTAHAMAIALRDGHLETREPSCE